jgi:hypothetical protein
MASGHVICSLPVHSFCIVTPTYSSTKSISSHSFRASNRYQTSGWATLRSPCVSHIRRKVCVAADRNPRPVGRWMKLFGYATSRQKGNASLRQKLKPIPQARHCVTDADGMARCRLVFLGFHNCCHTYKIRLDYIKSLNWLSIPWKERKISHVYSTLRRDSTQHIFMVGNMF